MGQRPSCATASRSRGAASGSDWRWTTSGPVPAPIAGLATGGGSRGGRDGRRSPLGARQHLRRRRCPARRHRRALPPSTQQRYAQLARRLTALIGSVRLQQLEAAQIQEAYAQLLAEGLAARTVLHHHRVLPMYHVGSWYDIFEEGAFEGFAGITARGGEHARPNQRVLVARGRTSAIRCRPRAAAVSWTSARTRRSS